MPKMNSISSIVLSPAEFESFVSRMWLDHCDENDDMRAIKYSLEEYKSLYYTWLKEKYALRRTRWN